MYTSSHTYKMLADEREADFKRDAEGKSGESTATAIGPVPIARRKRPFLPIIARGIAGLDPVNGSGQRSWR